MADQTIRVFVNASGVDVVPGSTAIDAVRTFDEDLAREVDDAKRLITDSRGLPIDATTPMVAGYIMRLVLNRAGARDHNEEVEQ